MLKRLREKLNNERGLTLVELLAVIVILAIVGAIAFVMIGKYYRELEERCSSCRRVTSN